MRILFPAEAAFPIFDFSASNCVLAYRRVVLNSIRRRQPPVLGGVRNSLRRPAGSFEGLLGHLHHVDEAALPAATDQPRP
jgi:hypothetical protein